MPETTFSTIKVDSGRYLMPSHDELQLYRIRQVEEDGTLEVTFENGRTRTITGKVWNVEKLKAAPPHLVHRDKDGRITGIARAVGLDEYEFEDLGLFDEANEVQWHEVASLFKTKKDAVDWIRSQA